VFLTPTGATSLAHVLCNQVLRDHLRACLCVGWVTPSKRPLMVAAIVSPPSFFFFGASLFSCVVRLAASETCVCVYVCLHYTYRSSDGSVTAGRLQWGVLKKGAKKQRMRAKAFLSPQKKKCAESYASQLVEVMHFFVVVVVVSVSTRENLFPRSFFVFLCLPSICFLKKKKKTVEKRFERDIIKHY
jgi:hypothetical protein